MRFQMSDKTIVDTDNASAYWEDRTVERNGRRVSLVSQQEYYRETLYRSRKGRYYILQRQIGSCPRDHAEWVSNEEAARWLHINEYDKTSSPFPDDLRGLVDELTE